MFRLARNRFSARCVVAERKSNKRNQKNHTNCDDEVIKHFFFCFQFWCVKHLISVNLTLEFGIV